MTDPLVIRMMRGAAILIGIAMMVFVLVAAPIVMGDSGSLSIFLVTGPMLFIGGFQLARAGFNGRGAGWERMRGGFIRRQQYIERYHDGETR